MKAMFTLDRLRSTYRFVMFQVKKLFYLHVKRKITENGTYMDNMYEHHSP